jgi:leucyl-tRNA synthetase
VESRYNPADIEEKWQKDWAAQKLSETPTDRSKPKFYALSMFPYPSGNLHMGHVRVYTIVDVIARLKRMQGFRVLNPMGWDAFGLPAENAAIERNIHPAKWTYSNIAQMKVQLDALGISFDWNKEIATCSPNYYKWTQWMFLQFVSAGLAYQKEAIVNWDPIDQTVLANEQVDTEGRSWRSGAKVERKQLRQWFFKITDYAEQLLQDLDQLDGWPERVRTMQANWIGKSTGAQVTFKTEIGDDLPVYTTRPDTLWGASFMVISPEHPYVEKLTKPEQSAAIKAYQEASASKSEIDRTAEGREKTGVWTGSYATNPVNDLQIPIWIADYVMMDYGTGAIMAVPAHDQRDFEFAKKFGLEIKVVVQPIGEILDGKTITKAFTDSGVMANSGPLDGITAGKGKDQSVDVAVQWLESQTKGKGTINYRLRDWLVSRQRYWGSPIPIIHCPDCGAVPVPDDQLPVELPEDVEFSGKGSPLAKLESWVNVPCPSCGTPAKRETDTMDTFMCSSWYFMRYPDAQNDKAAFDPAIANDWMQVDQYVGGIEHAILHLLYSRFFTKVVRDRGLLNCDEPFKRLLTQGMVQSKAYKNPKTGQYITPENISDMTNPMDPETGDTLDVVYEKMSKSKYNGVAPSDVIDKYGADTARMFILFKAPPEKDLEWDDADVEGQFRFMNRIWRVVTESGVNANVTTIASGNFSKSEKDLRRAIHIAIKEITEDLTDDYQFNTAISELMKLNNALNDFTQKDSPVFAEGIQTLLRLLAPFAPHIADELWHSIGNAESIHTQTFPVLDSTALVVDEITIVIQILGKMRGSIMVPSSSTKDEIEALATASEVAQKYIEGKEIKKTIVVPGKLVNFVIV